MTYSGYSGSKGPRKLRVIVGGLMTTSCLMLGSIIFTHQFHRALMMQPEPEELDWTTLAERGPIDNAYIELIDVDLDRSDPMAELEDMFGEIDPDADEEELLELFEESMDEVNPLQMVQMAIAPVKVIPSGTDADSVRKAIVIPRVEMYLDEAERQLEENGTIAGYVSTYQGDEFVRAIMQYAGGEELLEEIDKMGPIDKIYTLEPMAQPLSRADAGSNFWLCGFGMALGLIICGSGGPALSTVIFFTVPSILSLLGYPMRYGRGSTMARMIYLVVGAGLVGYGFRLMVMQGGFGQIGGNPILHSLGFISIFFGVASLLATPAQILSRKFEASMDVAPTPKKEIKMSVADACSLEPVEAISSIFTDRNLVASEAHELPDELAECSESLVGVGFSVPEVQSWHDGDSESPTAIQLGCQDMVVAELVSSAGRVESRLVSVLHDGMTIITLSSQSKCGSNRRVGTNGLYVRSRHEDPAQMLSEHLEETISVAERRDTTVVTFEESEIESVCLLSQRVFADVQAQWGEETMEVDSAVYGRFQFPMQSVLEGAAV